MPSLRTAAIALAALGLAAAGPAALSETPIHLPSGVEPTADDGRIPADGIGLAETRYAAISRLDPALLRAVRRAARDAAVDGIAFRVTSGWRSAGRQRELYDDAVAEHGPEAAARLVKHPSDSEHVTGDAIDIGPTDAAYWLAQHGAAYGLCQVYANEIWHYELRTQPGSACPPMRADAMS